MRKIVFVGNCQADAMMNLYRRFVAFDSRDILIYVASYEAMTPQGQSAILNADLVVEQVFDLGQEVIVGDLALKTRRFLFPLVMCGFLWPFGGHAHPRNEQFSFLQNGPYPAEFGDSYLNQKILAGVPPETAVADYLALDVNSARNLDRLFTHFMERQRRRDDLSGFNIADIVSQWFRDEHLFVSPGHPNLRLSMALSVQLFHKMGVPGDRIERMQDFVRTSPFPKDMLPIHPGVIRHFGLRFVSADSRYLSKDGCSYTFTEYADRYMRYEWNRELREGIMLSQTHPQNAIDLLRAGLSKAAGSAEGHFALGEALGSVGQAAEAASLLRRATELDPTEGRFYYGLARMLRNQDRVREALEQIKLAVACDESDPRFHVFAAQLLIRLGEFEAAEQAVRQAVRLEPHNPHFLNLLARVLADRGDVAEAVVLVRTVIDLAPDFAGFHIHRSHLLTRQGDIHGAISAVERAIQLKPAEPDYHAHLGRLQLRVGDSIAAETSARRAIALRPDQAILHESRANILV